MDVFLEAFWGEDGFEHLRKYTRNGSEYFKELIGVLEERVELEEHYAKGLQKLSTRLMKAAKNVVGAVDTAWKFVAVELENEASIHRNLGTALEEEIVKPLKTVSTSHQKTRKTIESTVEKSIKHAATRRAAQEKSKKASHHLAGDLEKVTNVLTRESRRACKSLSDKQTNKLTNKRTKLEEHSIAADQAFHDSTLAAESERQHLELVLTAAALRIEMLEETRLANLQTALGRYHCHLSQLGPGLTNACNQQFQSRIDSLLSVDPRQDLALIVSQSQPPSQQAFRTVVLCDFYAEDFSNSMDVDRRKETFNRYLSMFEKDLEKEQRKSHIKIDQLSTLYEEYPLFSDVQTKMTLKDKVTDRLAMMNFVDYHVYKFRCSLASLSNSSMGAPDSHKLSKYENKQKDKMGLRQTLLRIPLPDARNGVPPPNQRRPSLYVTTTLGHYETRQSGDGQSPPRRQVDEGIESAYEHLDTESSIDTFSEASSSGARHESCRALYDFEPQQEDQLAIYAGDIIRITEKTTDDWWQGEVSGRIGLFPANYVKEM